MAYFKGTTYHKLDPTNPSWDYFANHPTARVSDQVGTPTFMFFDFESRGTATCKETSASNLHSWPGVNVAVLWSSPDRNLQNSFNLIQFFEKQLGFKKPTELKRFHDKLDVQYFVPSPQWRESTLASSIFFLLIRSGFYFDGNIENWLTGKGIKINADVDHITKSSKYLREVLERKTLYVISPEAKAQSYANFLVNFSTQIYPVYQGLMTDISKHSLNALIGAELTIPSWGTKLKVSTVLAADKDGKITRVVLEGLRA